MSAPAPARKLRPACRQRTPWPFGALILTGTDVRMGFRWCGGRRFERWRVAYGNIAEVGPIRHLGRRGVIITPGEGDAWYFWTGRTTEILDGLRRHGVALALDR